VDCATGERELVFTKLPYPTKSEYMYGMSHHNIQLNYLPKHLIPNLPPTDSRLRPDQQATEKGDYKLATFEKNRLEVKQRFVKKYNDAHKI
jgi:oxysterol-binding protein 1